jgi:hypothetical protein
MKCDQCELESNLEQVFIENNQWWGLVKKNYCPACWENRYLREQLGSILWIAAGLIVFDALTFKRGFEVALFDVLMIGLMNIPLILGHELAHAAIGRLLGVRVFGVTVGFGPVIFCRRIFGINWEARLWPLGGGTMMASPPQKNSRWRIFGAVFAGPILHGVLIFAAMAVLAFLLILRVWFKVDTSTVSFWIILFLTCNLLLVIFNLLPVKAATPSGQLGTDGWQLFHLAFQKPDEQEIQDQSYYVMEALDGLRRSDSGAALRWIEQGLVNYPDQPTLRNVQAAALIETERYSEAREVLRSLLSSEETKNTPFKFLLYNNIAYADLLLKNPDLLPEAEKFSADAYRQMWWMPEIVGTRGTVLVEMGKLEEGMGLLREAMGRSKNSRSRAANACHLAVAESRAGHAEQGRLYFELARKLDPKCYLLGQTARTVGAE